MVNLGRANTVHSFPAVHTGHIVEGTQRIDDLLLHGGTLHDFLVYNLESYEVHIERHVRGVLHLGMEIEQLAVCVKPLEQVLIPRNACSRYA